MTNAFPFPNLELIFIPPYFVFEKLNLPELSIPTCILDPPLIT